MNISKYLLLHPFLKNHILLCDDDRVFFTMDMEGSVVRFHLTTSAKHIGGFNLFMIDIGGIFFDGGVGKWDDSNSNLELIETDNVRSNLIIKGIDMYDADN